MTLLELQMRFPHLLAQLFEWLWNHGYEFTGGEWWRSDEAARLDALEGKGISRSLHRLRIAIDLNLFRDGKYLSDFDSYIAPGQFWESLSSPGVKCVWGGRFMPPDSDHFSIEYQGVR